MAVLLNEINNFITTFLFRNLFFFFFRTSNLIINNNNNKSNKNLTKNKYIKNKYIKIKTNLTKKQKKKLICTQQKILKFRHETVNEMTSHFFFFIHQFLCATSLFPSKQGPLSTPITVFGYVVGLQFVSQKKIKKQSVTQLKILLIIIQVIGFYYFTSFSFIFNSAESSKFPHQIFLYRPRCQAKNRESPLRVIK